MRERAGSDAAFIAAVLAKFRDEEYFYTLEPPRLQLDSVDDFLFNTRRGFCEHFASAFTMLARAAGIPARVVTGYQGGEYNPMGGYLLIRQSDAHAWSEVWLEGRGWVRVDPTAAVAPERVERGLDAAMTEAASPARPPAAPERIALAAAPCLGRGEHILERPGRRLRRSAAAMAAANASNVDDADWEQLGHRARADAGCVLRASCRHTWRGASGRAPADPLAQVYDQLCRKLARHGLPRAAHEGPTDYVDSRGAGAARAGAAAGGSARSCMSALRYGPRSWGSQLNRPS